MKRAKKTPECKAELLRVGADDFPPIIVNGPEFTIGRSKAASLILTDVTISRNHCVIKYVNGSWNICDQSSMGTFVNGKKLTKNIQFSLKSGDVIHLGPNSSFNYVFNIIDELSDKHLKKQCFRSLPEAKSTLSHMQKQLRRKIEQTQLETSVMEIEHSQLEASLQNGLDMIDKRYEAEQASLFRRISSHSDELKLKAERTALEQQFNKEKEELVRSMKSQMEELQKKISEKQQVEQQLTLDNQKLHEELQKERSIFKERLEKGEEQVQLERKRVQELEQKHQETIASLEEGFTIAGMLQEQEMAEKSKAYEEERKTIQTALLEKEKALEVTEEKLKKEGEVRNKFQDVLETELQCSVCNELFVCAVTLNCTHTFCQLCITQWKERKKDCPVCRAKITSETRMLLLDGFIEKAVDNLSEELKTRRMEIVEEKSKAMLAYQQKATSSTTTTTTAPQRNTRQRARGRRRSSTRDEVVEVVSEELDQNSIYVSSDEDAISLSGSDSDSSVDGVPGEYYGGYGYCYRCGRRGHWARGCPDY